MFAASHYSGIKTPLSSRRISKEPAVRSHEGAVGPCLVLRRKHVSHIPSFVFVCSQIGSKSPKSLLMALTN